MNERNTLQTIDYAFDATIQKYSSSQGEIFLNIDQFSNYVAGQRNAGVMFTCDHGARAMVDGIDLYLIQCELLAYVLRKVELEKRRNDGFARKGQITDLSVCNRLNGDRYNEEIILNTLYNEIVSNASTRGEYGSIGYTWLNSFELVRKIVVKHFIQDRYIKNERLLLDTVPFDAITQKGYNSIHAYATRFATTKNY